MQKSYPSTHTLPFHFRTTGYANASPSHFGKVGKIDWPPRADGDAERERSLPLGAAPIGRCLSE